MVGFDASSGPKIVGEWILDPVWKFLFKGTELPCDIAGGWKRYEDPTIPYCIAQDPDPTEGYQKTGTFTNNGNTIRWYKRSNIARNANQADDLNCAPGTNPFNGKCMTNCDEHTIAEYADSAGADPNAKICSSICDKWWHKLDWKASVYPSMAQHGNESSQEQQMILNNNFCYHVAYSAQRDGLTTPESKSLIPFNLAAPTTRPNDWAPLPEFPRTHIRRIKDDCKSIGDMSRPGMTEKESYMLRNDCYEARGIFAERRSVPLDADVLPVPCNPPNLLTSRGDCKVPCPVDWELKGDSCVYTGMPCPSKNYVESADKTYCVPKIDPIHYGWSLIQILGAIVGVAALCVIFIGTIRLIKR